MLALRTAGQRRLQLLRPRGVQEHARKLPNLIVVYRAKDQKLKGLATSDAVYCGVCHPKNEPVELEELD